MIGAVTWRANEAALIIEAIMSRDPTSCRRRRRFADKSRATRTTTSRRRRQVHDYFAVDVVGRAWRQNVAATSMKYRQYDRRMLLCVAMIGW